MVANGDKLLCTQKISNLHIRFGDGYELEDEFYLVDMGYYVNVIELEEGAKLVMITPYHHPKKYKDEIDKAIKESLEIGHIWPSKSPFASTVVLVKKKDGMMCICNNYKTLNKKTIKNRYPIP